MKIGRRGWIVVGSASVLALGGLSVLTAHEEEFVIALIRHELRHVAIDDRDLARFAADFVALESERMTLVRRIVAEFPGVGFSEAVRRRLPADVADRLVMFERRLFASFFTSTGYFDEHRGSRLRYEKLHDPYEAVCDNPLFPSDGPPTTSR